MGAVTSLLYMGKYHSKNQRKNDTIIKAAVLDSPFSSLPRLLSEIAAVQLPLLPQFMVESILEQIQTDIHNKLSAGSEDYNPTKEQKDFSLYELIP